MSYLEQFLSSLRFYVELNPAEAAPRNFDGLRQHFLHRQSPAQVQSMTDTRKFLTWLAEHFVEGYPGDLAHACHAASAGFLHSWNASRRPGLAGTLSVTVGSVRYKGTPVFETTRAAIAGLIAAGRAPAIDLPVHVWLTLDDLTVIDLSIVPTLVKYGHLPADTPPVLFWREDAAGDFAFEPLLVDNQFFERVDSGKFMVPPWY